MTRTTWALAAILLAFAPLRAEEPPPPQDASPRIGFVDLRRVLQECPHGKEVAAAIQKETESYDREVQRLQGELESATHLAQSLPAGSPDLDKYKKQIEEVKASLDRATAARQVGLEGLNLRLRPACWHEVQEAVAAVAAEQGAVAVLNQKALPAPEKGMDIWSYELESQTVVFCTKGTDLTDLVLAELKRRASGEPGVAREGTPPKPAPPATPGAPASADRTQFGRPVPAAKAVPAAAPAPEDGDAYRARLKAELKAEILAELGRAPAAGQPGSAPAAAAPAEAQPASDAEAAQGSGAIEGSVVSDGAGVAGCQIKAIQVIERSGFLGGTVQYEGKEFLATTGADGRYRFEHVPPGGYFLKWLPPGSPTWIRRAREKPDVEVQAGQTAQARQIDLNHAVIGH